MAAFSQHIKLEARKPPRTITLPQSAFADGRGDDTPSTPQIVGLRLLAEQDLLAGRSEAAKKAWLLHPETGDLDARIEAYNDSLLCWAVARATCKPTNIDEPFWTMAEDSVPVVLSPSGVRFIWDELDRLTIETSPLSPLLGDDEIPKLTALLEGSALENLPLAQRTSVRRLLRHCLDALAETDALEQMIAEET